MRLIALILTLAGLAAAGFAGQSLWQTLEADEAEAETPAQQAAVSGGGPPTPARAARIWPALFGERQPPAPPAPAQLQAEPQPPKPPKPPLTSLGYTLKGVVKAGNATWAIVSHPTGERLLRRGEKLDDGVQVVRIDERGLWLSRDGDDAELMAFPD